MATQATTSAACTRDACAASSRAPPPRSSRGCAEHGLRGEDDEDEHRVGGGVAVAVAAREGPAVGLRDQDVGGAVGLAARDQEDDVEHVEGPDRAEQHRRQQRRARAAAG